jgi:hypothetical protein
MFSDVNGGVAVVQVQEFLRGPEVQHYVKGFGDTAAAKSWAEENFGRSGCHPRVDSGYTATAEVSYDPWTTCDPQVCIP